MFHPNPADTFVEIDHEICSMVILLLPLIPDAGLRTVVSYKRKNAHRVLVKRLV